MGRTTSGASDERWDERLGRFVPTGFASGRRPRGSLEVPMTVKDGPLRIFRRKGR